MSDSERKPIRVLTEANYEQYDWTKKKFLFKKYFFKNSKENWHLSLFVLLSKSSSGVNLQFLIWTTAHHPLAFLGLLMIPSIIARHLRFGEHLALCLDRVVLYLFFFFQSRSGEIVACVRSCLLFCNSRRLSFVLTFFWCVV